MHRLYLSLVAALVRDSLRRPWLWILAVSALAVPALWQAGKTGIDTDLIRLLPRHARASVLTRQLEDVVSDGGYFSVALEGDDHDRLLEAAEYVAGRLRGLPEVQSVQYTWPIDFVKKYKYLLVPNDYLERVYDRLLDWEAEVNPFVENLGGGGGENEESFGDEEDRKDLEIALRRYKNLSPYHESDDGRIMGMLVRTSGSVTNVGEVRGVLELLKKVAAEAGDKYGVWTGITGSHRNKLDDLDMIMKDVNRSGSIGGGLILAVLLVSFRSLAAVVVVLFPLAVGLAWSFALVPLTMGDLNLITSFLIVILFGMGVDYTIHLVKRFQAELAARPPGEALRETFVSTGASVVVSAVTTALSLSMLAVSDFRGFSEFGIIGALSITMILLAIFLVLPATLAVASRHGFLKPAGAAARAPFLPGRAVTALLVAAMAVLSVAAATSLGFEYNLDKLQFRKQRRSPEAAEAKERLRGIYSGSISPGAIYLADDLEAVDRFTALLAEAKKKEGTTIGRVRSIRDYAPGEEAGEERMTLLADIKELVGESWTDKIDDETYREVVRDFRAWEIPPRPPSVDEIPGEIRRTLEAKDGSGRLIITVHPNVDRSDGRNAMAFAGDLYAVPGTPGVTGPIGETVVFAEILWIVTGEAWWLSLLTLAGIFLIVLASRRNLREALWILLPLAAAVTTSLGLCAAFGFRLNFFNIVVIPALLGMGVDGGVHYYRRWKECGRSVRAAQDELFTPLSLAIGTTMIGYAGMVFASHFGIRSIGIFACLGLATVWIATLVVLPGLLAWFSPGDGEGAADK